RKETSPSSSHGWAQGGKEHGSGRLPSHQGGGQDHPRGGVTVDHVQQQTHHFLADPGPGLTDGGQGRNTTLGNGRVVKTTDGHVLGHTPARPVQGLQRPGGHQIGGDEDRVQIGGAFQELSHGPFTALVGVVAHGDPVLVHRTQHVMKALPAFHTTGGVLWPGNGGDVLTPDLAQVMDHAAGPVAWSITCARSGVSTSPPLPGHRTPPVVWNAGRAFMTCWVLWTRTGSPWATTPTKAVNGPCDNSWNAPPIWTRSSSPPI